MYGFRRYKTPTTNAYLDIMQHYHLFNEDYFILKENGMLDVKTGEQLTEEALEKWGNDLPTAILAYNDAFAIGVIHTLAAHGIKVPEEISVMGINDISISQYVLSRRYPLSMPLLKKWARQALIYCTNEFKCLAFLVESC